MSERPPRRPAVIDLVAFLAVLTTGLLFVALHVTGAAFVMVTGALATLYTAWAASGHRHPPETKPAEQAESAAETTPPGDTGQQP
jgi:membrane protein implicated in regulation of membrane protease activity